MCCKMLFINLAGSVLIIGFCLNSQVLPVSPGREACGDPHCSELCGALQRLSQPEKAVSMGDICKNPSKNLPFSYLVSVPLGRVRTRVRQLLLSCNFRSILLLPLAQRTATKSTQPQLFQRLVLKLTRTGGSRGRRAAGSGPEAPSVLQRAGERDSPWPLLPSFPLASFPALVLGHPPFN